MKHQFLDILTGTHKNLTIGIIIFERKVVQIFFWPSKEIHTPHYSHEPCIIPIS